MKINGQRRNVKYIKKLMMYTSLMNTCAIYKMIHNSMIRIEMRLIELR